MNTTTTRRSLRNTNSTESTINPVDHMALVHHIVNRVAKGFPPFVERDDLVQAGMVGLVEAANRFDAESGTSFASFASRRIEGAILDYVRADSWMPRQLRAVEKQISAVEDRFAIDGDNSDATVAQELDLQVDQLRAIRRDLARARTTSLDRVFDDAGSPMSESIESNDMSPADKAEFEELRRLLVAGIELLSDKQRHVITRYYIEEIGLSDIADEMGVGISRVSKIKQSAIEKLGEGIQAQFTARTEPRTRHQAAQQQFADAMAIRAAS